jgi:hypothetical protein
MAINIHVAQVGLFSVDATTGLKLNKDSTSVTINQMKNTEQRHLVIPDTGIPNSTNSPNVKEYLELEASSDYILGHMDQYTIVTYDRGGVNTAS